MGTFGTPLGSADTTRFEQAATSFARCVSAHGYPEFGGLRFGGGDAFAAFWALRFAWGDERFSAALDGR